MARSSGPPGATIISAEQYLREVEEALEKEIDLKLTEDLRKPVIRALLGYSNKVKFDKVGVGLRVHLKVSWQPFLRPTKGGELLTRLLARIVANHPRTCAPRRLRKNTIAWLRL